MLPSQISPARRLAARPGPVLPEASAAEGGAHLVFMLNGQPYACSISSIEKLVRVADVLIVPVADKSQPWRVGTLREQGEAVPVIRLDALWGVPERLRAADSAQSVMVVRRDGERVALLVGGCRGVLKTLPPAAARMRLPHALTNQQGTAFESIMPWGGELLVEVRLERLLDRVLPESVSGSRRGFPS
jgi:chemotaxis signal transduction protein